MKPFISALFRKFNAWIAICIICIIGGTLVSLPMTALADPICVVVSARNVACGRPVSLYVDHTGWILSPTPWSDEDYFRDPELPHWVFSRDGLMGSNYSPLGVWQVISEDTISVSDYLTDTTLIAQYEVKFTSPTEFIVYEKGQPSLYGLQMPGTYELDYNWGA